LPLLFVYFREIYFIKRNEIIIISHFILNLLEKFLKQAKCDFGCYMCPSSE
jgi:hypothetical protein